MSKEGKTIKIVLNFSERALYSAIALVFVLIVSVGVYAVSHPNPGHSASEIEEADPTVLDFAKTGTMECSGA